MQSHPLARRGAVDEAASTLHRLRLGIAVIACAALTSGCALVSSALAPAPAAPLRCDDSLKTAFRPDAQTRVVAVRALRKGETLIAVDSAVPVTLAGDMCLVKLLVGPGATAEKDTTARSYSEGIGIEIWLPAPNTWNQRIRNYGGGGWVGGGHRIAGQIGSKLPAIVNANIGYAVGTTDAGQAWDQDGSFAFLSNGKLNFESLRDFSHRAMLEQALKTQALVKQYYGRAHRYAYFDGQSQGGRQGMRMAQAHPELYDGYMIAQPALSIPRMGITGLYAQVVMKTELGFTAADKPRAAAFAKKVEAVNARAVKSCDAAGLGFLLDPFACAYDPGTDAGALCTGVAGRGVTGSNADAGTCMSPTEALALAKIWYGATRDGSFDMRQSTQARGGQFLGPQQLWWPLTRGASISGQITGAGADHIAVALQDVSYAADASTSRGHPIRNSSTPVRNRWQELGYAGLADALDKYQALQPALDDLATDNADLRPLRNLGRKIIMHSGLAEDVIPPAGNVNYVERVAAGMGGHSEVQQFMRLYLIPGMAHSSQGRASTVSGNNNSVPLPQLPGNTNQTPTREQDQFFSALVDWVETGAPPEDITIRSRDGSVSYPVCVYPKKTTWDGKGSAKLAWSYRCQ